MASTNLKATMILLLLTLSMTLEGSTLTSTCVTLYKNGKTDQEWERASTQCPSQSEVTARTSRGLVISSFSRLVLRGGKKNAVGLNKYGSWNVGGKWSKGDRKIKLLRTPDGFTFSRSQMRRQKRKWKQEYGDEAKEIAEREKKPRKGGERGAVSEEFERAQEENAIEEETFTPEGLMEKVNQLRKRLNMTSSPADDKEALRALKKEEAGQSTGQAQIKSQSQSQSQSQKFAKDGNLDQMAKAIFKEEFCKGAAQGDPGACFIVSGAGSSEVNGMYEKDRRDLFTDTARYKMKSSEGTFTLLFVKDEAKGQVKGKGARRMGRWIIFCNSAGVKRERPYYQAVMLKNPCCL